MYITNQNQNLQYLGEAILQTDLIIGDGALEVGRYYNIINVTVEGIVIPILKLSFCNYTLQGQ